MRYHAHSVLFTELFDVYVVPQPQQIARRVAAKTNIKLTY